MRCQAVVDRQKREERCLRAGKVAVPWWPGETVWLCEQHFRSRVNKGLWYEQVPSTEPAHTEGAQP